MGSVFILWTTVSLFILCTTVHGGFDVDHIDEVIKAAFQCHNNPGLIVSVVKEGKVLFSRGYGVTDLERFIPVDNETLFNVASLSKNMAAALLVKLLAENTNLTVDSRVKDLLRDNFLLMDDFRTHEMTFADLMGHRTAIPPNNIIRFDSTLTREGLLRRLPYLKAPDQYRVKYYYNNLMYGLVTYIAEVLGKAPWEDLITKHFFQPLGMTKSTFVTRVDYSRHDVAWPYVEKDGLLVRVPFEHSRRWGLLAGSVALVTTADDMTKWMNFHLSKGKDVQGRVVMEEELLNELYTPRMALPTPASRDFLKPYVPYTISRDTYTFGLRRGYYKGYTRLSHTGSNHGFRALLSLLPSEKTGVFMGMTGRDDGYQLRLPLQMYLTDLALGLQPWLNASTICSYPAPWHVPTPQERPSVSQNAPSLLYSPNLYVGSYHNKAYGALDVHFNQSLSSLILTYGWATWQLVPSRLVDNEEEFHAQGIDLTIAYDLDPIKFIKGSTKMVKIKASGFEPHAPPEFERELETASSQGRQQRNGAISSKPWSLVPLFVSFMLCIEFNIFYIMMF